MPWTDQDLRAHFKDHPDQGEQLVAARAVCGSFTFALRDGYVDNFLPAPGIAYDPAYVEKALGTLDRQYRHEHAGRGGGRTLPQFGSLPLTQRIAFVQRMRHALGKD